LLRACFLNSGQFRLSLALDSLISNLNEY
jgi:hypothetical protein